MSGTAGRIEAEATVSWSGWGGEVTSASGKLKAQTATQVELGGPGDKPVVGDWNDDGKDDPGVYHPGAATNRVAKRAG